MNCSRHTLAATIAAACFAIAACHKDDSPAASGVDATTLQRAQDQLSQPARLHDHLPAGTVGYLRLPSPWTVIGSVPDGRPLDAATASDAHLKAIAGLREAIAHDPLLAQSGLAPYLLPLLVDLRSPIEVLAVDPIGVISPGTRVLVAMRLAQRTPAEVAARLAALPAELHLAQPFDANGNAMLAMGAPLHFDATNQQLTLLGGRQGADAAALMAMLDSVRQAGSDTPAAKAMLADEQAIDASGEGLFGWGSLHGLGSLATGAVPTTSIGTLPGDLLGKIDSVAFGAGSVDGHGTAQIRLRVPQARLLGYLAPAGFDPAFKVAGPPRWVANLALPDAAHWQAFEQNLALDFGPERATQWRHTMTSWWKALGVTPAEVTAWIGPELIAFEDDAGSFVALRVRDRTTLYERLGKLAKARGGQLLERRIDGASIHELDLPHRAGMPSPTPAPDGARSTVEQLMGRIATHLYWLEDGDFLIFGTVPQSLADRLAAKPALPLAGWLTAQAYPGRESLAGVAARTHEARRKAYYAYLQLLQLVDDVTGGQVDLATLPAAHTLNLPRDGMIGASVGVRPDGLVLRVDYAQQPLELLGAAGSGSGTTGIAVMAILAAIAVPAYQKYMVRSEVAAGLALAAPVKQSVADYRRAHGRWPADNRTAGVAAAEAIHGDNVKSVTVQPDGAVVVTFGNAAWGKGDARLTFKQVTFTPEIENGQISWHCASMDLREDWLPAACRMNSH